MQVNFTLEQQLDSLFNTSAKSNSYYKVMSRNCLLFVFPPNLERLWPKDIKDRTKAAEGLLENLYGKEGDDDHYEEADDAEGDEIVDMPEATSLLKAPENYIQMKNRILDGLTHQNLTVNESEYNLSVLSPKYVKIYQKIEYTPGQVLCYSQFRTVEGIEVFRRVLEAHGYSPYEIGYEGVKRN